MMKPLSKGDTCRVRLHTGEVVDAVYDIKSMYRSRHYVLIDGILYLADKYKPTKETELFIGSVRFVGPSCVLLPVGVSV